jgi:TetR/AcrR family transcriptional regulator of autoinduction and epiphytic fitness
VRGRGYADLPTVTDPARVDGRHERSKRTHAAIVSALTELLDEGHVEITAPEIAQRAGVALRSIGQHFASREDLLLAVARHHAERLAAGTVDPDGTLEDRIERFVAQRARVLETSRTMRRAAALVEPRSPTVARALEETAEQRRRDAARVFAREIAAAGEPCEAERAVALVTSGRAWDALRGELGLGVRAARAQVAYLLRSLLRRGRR